MPVSAVYSHFQATSGQMTSLLAHFRSPKITWRHFLSRDCLLWAIGLKESRCAVPARFRPFAATSRWLPVKWRHFRVTFVHLRSCHVIFCHVTASSSELQPCGKWNVQYMWVFGPLQPLPGHFRSNDVTSGSLPETWSHVTSLSVTWLPPPASYFLVES